MDLDLEIQKMLETFQEYETARIADETEKYHQMYLENHELFKEIRLSYKLAILWYLSFVGSEFI